MYAIYGNIYHHYTPVMLAYIPAPWILWVWNPEYVRICQKHHWPPWHRFFYEVRRIHKLTLSSSTDHGVKLKIMESKACPSDRNGRTSRWSRPSNPGRNDPEMMGVGQQVVCRSTPSVFFWSVQRLGYLKSLISLSCFHHHWNCNRNWKKGV